MTWFKLVLLVVVGLVALVAVVGLFLPSKWRIERTVSIAAESETVRAYLDTPRQWADWSPWNQARYPDMVVDYEGPERGVGAAWRWQGKSSGTGRLEIVRSEAGQGVEYKLDCNWPVAGTISLAPAGGHTEVRWVMAGDTGTNPIAHYFGLFMDRIMGSDMETGLARIKQAAETKTP